MTYSNGGAVASESPEAAQAAITILNQGGNAIDAAVATSAVQCVTRPFSGGIGGGGYMVIYLAEENRHLVIDHQGVTPISFGPESFLNPKTGEIYPEITRMTSGMSIAVPGTIKGWEIALEKYGTMTLAEVLEPAIETAEHGFVANENLIREITENADRFHLFHSTRKIFLDENGRVPKLGSMMTNPDLAHTYRLVAKKGSRVFYEGEIAHAIVDTVSNPPFVENPNFSKVDVDWGQQEYGVINGELTLEDLKNYRTYVKNASKVSYRDFDIYGAPPAASGGITVGIALNILENYDFAHVPRTKAMHYYIEALRHAFADRSAYIGDPTHAEIPLSGLLSKEYATVRKQAIKDQQASEGPALCGNPWEFHGSSEQQTASTNFVAADGKSDIPETSTIHLTVSDKDGNIVSFTNTILSIGGSGMVVPGCGFLLNNMLHRVIPKNEPDHPDYPRPNMRPLSNMAPTIVMKKGQPVAALGSPGAETIMSTVLLTLINYLDFGMSLEEAIASPRLIQMNNEDGKTRYEGIFSDKYINPDGNDLVEELKKMGHQFAADERAQGVGSVTAVEFLSGADNRVRAIGEPTRRGSGTAMVQWPTKASAFRHVAE